MADLGDCPRALLPAAALVPRGTEKSFSVVKRPQLSRVTQLWDLG
jgi:hypothetical protein